MPSFTIIQPRLRGTGPVVDVELAPGAEAEAAMRATGASIPQVTGVRAMFDSGAAASSIPPGTGAALGLQPVGTVPVAGPGGSTVDRRAFKVRFVLPNNVSLDVVAVELPLGGQDVQCLIGRDVLSRGVLVYIGYADTFSFSI